MAADRILMLKLLGDTSSMDKSLRRSEGRMKSFGRTVGRWGTAIVADFAIQGVEKLTDAIGTAWTGFREGEKAAGQLSTTWRNLGLDGSKLSGTIDRISDSTLKLGTDDTEAIMAFNRALQATGGKPAEAMKRLRIAQDLVANGSAPNLNSALGLIQQAAKGSARVVDRFGLKSKTAAGRVAELGNKVKGAAEKAAAMDPLGVLFNKMNEDLEGIVGSLASGDLEGALKNLQQIGTDLGVTWDKVDEKVTPTLDKLSGGKWTEAKGSAAGLQGDLQGIQDRFEGIGEALGPDFQESFGNLVSLMQELQPHLQNAASLSQPVADLFTTIATGFAGMPVHAAGGFFGGLTELLRGNVSGAADKAGQGLLDLLGDFDKTLGELPSKTGTALVGEGGVLSQLTSAVQPITDEALKIGQGILNKVTENTGLIPMWLDSTLNGEGGILGKLGSALSPIGDAASGIGKAIFDGITGLLGDIAGKVQGVLDDINKALGGVAQLGTVGPNRDGAGGGGVGGHGGGIPPRYGPGGSGGGGKSGPRIPMAEGGIVRHRPGGVDALLGEGRHDEAVIPLDGRHGLGGNTYNVNVYVAPGGDMVEAGRQMVRAIKQYERRSGHVWRAA